MALRLGHDIEPTDDPVVNTSLYRLHVRRWARSMDAATLQAALEFHRMHVSELMLEIRERAEMARPEMKRLGK